MQRQSSTRPLLCHELVDCKHEMQELNEALQRAATAQPQLVLLAGEAGLGKTKLCRAFMQTSRQQQAVVLFGLAIPQDQSLPFGPFLDAFRRYFTAIVKTLSDTHHSLHTSLTSLLQLFPELASTFSGSIALRPLLMLLNKDGYNGTLASSPSFISSEQGLLDSGLLHVL